MAERAPGIQPSCTIFEGANGSGKSTIFELLKPTGELINADKVARRMSPGSPDRASLAAGREVLNSLRGVVEHREDFTDETTLSSHQACHRCAIAGRQDID